MAQTAKDTLIARIDADIAKLQNMRDYVMTAQAVDVEDAPKVRKPRGPNKRKGLPEEPGL